MIRLGVKRILKERGLSQKELADKLGITEVGLSKSIGDRGNPTLSTLESISRALSVNITELFEPIGISGVIQIDGKPYIINCIADIENILIEVKSNK